MDTSFDQKFSAFHFRNEWRSWFLLLTPFLLFFTSKQLSITFWMFLKVGKNELMWKEGDLNLCTCILHMRVTVNDVWPQFVVIPISTVFCKMHSLPMSCIDIPIIWNIIVSFLTSDRKVCILKRFCLRLHLTYFFLQRPGTKLSPVPAAPSNKREAFLEDPGCQLLRDWRSWNLKIQLQKKKSGVKKMD